MMQRMHSICARWHGGYAECWGNSVEGRSHGLPERIMMSEQETAVAGHTISLYLMTEENEVGHASVSINFSDSCYFVSFRFISNEDALHAYEALSKMLDMSME
jgi:hypothetical protein